MTTGICVLRWPSTNIPSFDHRFSKTRFGNSKKQRLTLAAPLGMGWIRLPLSRRLHQRFGTWQSLARSHSFSLRAFQRPEATYTHSCTFACAVLRQLADKRCCWRIRTTKHSCRSFRMLCVLKPLLFAGSERSGIRSVLLPLPMFMCTVGYRIFTHVVNCFRPQQRSEKPCNASLIMHDRWLLV